MSTILDIFSISNLSPASGIMICPGSAFFSSLSHLVLFVPL